MCLRYETDIQPDSSSSNTIQKLEIDLIDTKVVFALNKDKKVGDYGESCANGFVSDLLPKNNLVRKVKIQHSEGNDGWGVKSLEIQQYPGSTEYDIYVLDKNRVESRFWTDSDGEDYCQDNMSSDRPCCSVGEWCDLEVKKGKHY